MAAEYVSAPIAVDPDELAEEAFDYLRSVIPGWEPADGNLDVWLVEAFAQLAAQVAEAASDVPPAIFRAFGETIVGVAPISPAAASGTATFSAIDTAGHTIPAGTTVAFDDGQLFATVIEAAIPAGIATKDVAVTALEAGPDGNGLSGTASLVDPLDFVQAVTFATPTAGGTDGEADDVYLDRLADELRLLSPRPILVSDFATLAKRVPGVARATALDGYNPSTGTFGNEGMVAVVPVNAAGSAIVDKTPLVELFAGERALNVVVNVIDPTYSAIDVTFTAKAWDGWDPEEVEAAAIAALADYLSPANWGQPDHGGDAREWVNEPVVRYLEVAQVLNSVEGLRYVQTLTVEGGTADVTMAGAAPLPTSGTIAGTVT